MNALGQARGSMRSYGDDADVDAVVIGTGAGGAPLLSELAAAGLRVVALEAGPWWDAPHEQFATDELDASKLYWLGERLSAGETPIVFGGNNSGTGVGGSTLHWGAFVPRADARDLRLRTESGTGCDWPMTLDELRPYYERVESFLGVSGPRDYPWDPARRYPTGPVPINAPGQLMMRGFAALGLRATAAPIAALSEAYERAEYGYRPPCANRGFCHQGCRSGAKASMDVTYLVWAVHSGAEIRPHAFVHGFELDSAGKIRAVLYRDSSRVAEGGLVVERRLRCKLVILCAGGIETPRLLLHTGLGNGSGQVGQNFMAHVATQVWGTWDEPVRMNKGFPATVISEDTLRPPGADFVGGYLTQSLGVVPASFAQTVARTRGLWGKHLVDYLDRYNFVAGIGINGDCVPAATNYLELSEETDEHGVPKACIHFSYGAGERALSAHASALLSAAWQAAGARDVWTAHRTAHTIGTCRMGTSADASVVDPWGRSHEVANLWVCDNSVFPSALSANPALTIMALSLRTAESILAGRGIR
jgi:choline dehydrogenase-like flavoprotein